MYTCSRKLHFCAGHRVLGHENKCANPHGHNYIVYATASSALTQPLDTIGRVIDFSVIKAKLGKWLDDTWDHKFIAYEKDEAMIEALQSMMAPCCVLPVNPTAENMAALLLHEVCPMLFDGTGIIIKEIELWETENCKATVSI